MFEPVYHKLSRELDDYFRKQGGSGRLPGILKLSRQFCVSKNTMSKALHILRERGLISIENTKGMYYLGHTAGYQIRYRVIGISGLCGPVDRILRRLNEKYRESGFSLAYFDLPGQKTSSMIKKWLLQLPIDGVILLNGASLPDRLDLFYENHIPVIGCTYPGYEHISGYEPDHYAAYCRILNYLFRLGHRRIGLVAFKPNQVFQFYFDWIKAAFRDTLGTDYDEELIYSPASAVDYCRNRCEPYRDFGNDAFRYFSRLSPAPSAIISEHYILHYIRTAAEQSGLVIPRDLSLFSIYYYSQDDPFYTTAIVRDDRAVEYAFSKIIRMLNGESVRPEHILVPMTFKKGLSVSKCKRS